MDERARRIGENEALFRHLNEQIEGVNRSFAVLTQTMDLVCECGNRDCLERLLVTLPTYERIRSDPALFFVLPGHVVPSVEDVVDRAEGYLIVRKKQGDPAELAEATDPRR
jgi:hypothetical protein